jgi:acetylornithine deacetylase/succinyl-diaminopimelate desuccinylase-like protein
MLAFPYEDRRSLFEGADDDGSGSVTILEAYRALITSDFRPVKPVEFHWYSAEVGSSMCSTTVLDFNACAGRWFARLAGSCERL